MPNCWTSYNQRKAFIMSNQKVAVVTGANKGIGFAIVKGLCQRFNGIVYLTARDTVKGQNAVKDLNKLNLYPRFHQLDISSELSVNQFRTHIMQTHGKIDILINNAGFQIYRPYAEPLIKVAEKTMKNNYNNLRNMFFDLMDVFKFNARIINTSSSFGHLSNVPGKAVRDKFADPCLTIEKLDALAEDFLQSIRHGTNVADGWGDDPYKIAKVFVAALTFVQQKGVIFTNMKINCYNPGYVNTDFTHHMGVLTPDEGALPALYLALDAPNSIRGQFVWKDKMVIDWTGEFPDKE